MNRCVLSKLQSQGLPRKDMGSGRVEGRRLIFMEVLLIQSPPPWRPLLNWGKAAGGDAQESSEGILLSL